MRYIIIYLFIVVLSHPTMSLAAQSDFFSRPDLVEKYNPDGDKYEFVKAFLNAIQYIHKNNMSLDSLPEINNETISDGDKIRIISEQLIQENANLRVARNYFSDFELSQNGLMLKVVSLMQKLCNDYIVYNNKERELINLIASAQKNGAFDELDKEDLIQQFVVVSQQRKISLRYLLESSMYIPKILISDQHDDYGDFYMLGISEEERAKLLLKLDQFDGITVGEELQPGQTFIEASLVSIKSILMDRYWESKTSYKRW